MNANGDVCKMLETAAQDVILAFCAQAKKLKEIEAAVSSHEQHVSQLNDTIKDALAQHEKDGVTIQLLKDEIHTLQNTMETHAKRHEAEICAMQDVFEKEKAALVAEHKEKVRDLESELWNFKKVSQLIAFEKENAELRRELDRLQKVVESQAAMIPSPAANAPTSPYEGYAKSGHAVSGAGIASIAPDIVTLAKEKVTKSRKPRNRKEQEQIPQVHHQEPEPNLEPLEVVALQEPEPHVVALEQELALEPEANIEEDPVLDISLEEDTEETPLYEKKIQGKHYYVDDACNVYSIEDDGTPGDIIGTYKKENGKTVLNPLHCVQ